MKQRPNKKPAASCYDVALTQLGRRDFSSAELAKRLQDKGFEDTEVAEVMARLIDQRYVDDARYAKAVVRSRAQISGWGIQRIKMDMKRRLIPQDVIDTALMDYDEKIDKSEDDAKPWDEQAVALLEKKYGRWSGTLGPKDYNKRMGFLVRRGFTLDQARHALDATRDSL